MCAICFLSLSKTAVVSCSCGAEGFDFLVGQVENLKVEVLCSKDGARKSSSTGVLRRVACRSITHYKMSGLWKEEIDWKEGQCMQNVGNCIGIYSLYIHQESQFFVVHCIGQFCYSLKSKQSPHTLQIPSLPFLLLSLWATVTLTSSI
jgi:hypothetical protein